MELWCCLSKLTQDLGNTTGYTYGSLMILYFTMKLLGTYGFMSQIKLGKIWITVGFLVTAVIYTWLIFVLCNAAHRVTNK
ncbi:hypothetical protein L9F63_015182, partial [Diploptera punctata]